MLERSRSRLLELSLTSTPHRWVWQVRCGDDVIAEGFEKGQIEARFEGYNAMFLLLASGWN
jgi:hypothetical protein